MDKFIVSARKYRPQTFDTVVGQAHITTTLKNAIRNNQLAHAFLFTGPRGVGKTTCARILAKTINCENQTKEGEACNTCHSCVSFNDGISMNIHELDAASNNSVDDIRSLVEQVRFAPQAGKYKVYIIDEVHMLSSSAFNAFLKTLEEPPPYAIFILATTEKHKILPTILSRCQIFDFKRITIDDTVEHLQEICSKEDVDAEKAALQVISQKSEGCMRDALSIMDKIVSFTGGQLTYTNTLEHLNILDEDHYFKLLDSMLTQDLASAMLLFDSINRKGFEGDTVLNGFAEFIRNLLVCKDPKAAVLLETVESFRDRYHAVAKDTPAAILLSSLNILSEAEISFKSARNKRLHVELALIRLCYLRQALELTGDGTGVSKKKLLDTVKPLAFRQIRPFELKEEQGGEKLVIEQPSARRQTPEPATRTVTEPTGRVPADPSGNNAVKAPATAKAATATAGGTAIVAPATQAPSTAATTPATKPVSGKVSALDQIRQQFKGNSSANQVANEALTTEVLSTAWEKYITGLKEKRSPAVPSFQLAKLRITDENSFEVETANGIEQKFIEQERNNLFDFLRAELRNKALRYAVVISEIQEVRIIEDAPLSSTQQFLKMSEQYPLVRELKERLKLDLDY
ncbi:MAG: DNA polymerase III subunit gamma/tau [Chitinophagaceae bacterium]|nr:MAG: DNA polymerase III subunit gamma/tau [Chitinophagaceae bacterium]